MQAIRDAGFDDVMFWWGDDFRDTDGAPETQFDLAVRTGLQVRTVHFPTVFTYNLWNESDEDQAYVREMSTVLGACGQRGIKYLVVHAAMRTQSPGISGIGAERMRRAAEIAQKENVDIALENARFLAYNQYLYDHVDSLCLKFCFDSGHANCFTPGEAPLALFGSRLATTHLHDNHGPLPEGECFSTGDEHLLPGEGNISFDTLMPRIWALQPECYNLESSMSPQDREAGVTMEAFLSRSYKILRALTAGAAHDAP